MHAERVQQLLQSVREANPAVLLKSLKHCHAKNISSIVLRQADNGALGRAFLAWPGNELVKNTPHRQFPIVGPHSHRYPLHIYTICGAVTNYEMVRSSEGYMPLSYEIWRYKSPLNGGYPKRGYVGAERLCLRAIHPQPWGLFMKHEAVHSMSCRAFSAWEVIEGPNLTEETWLYTRPGSTFDTTGFYEPFASPEEVIEHVERFVSEGKLL